MSSRIVPRDSPIIGSLPWRRSVEANPPSPPPVESEYPPEPAVDEAMQFRAAIAGLEARLAAALRVADEREARALESGRKDGYESGHRDGSATMRAEAGVTLEGIRAEASERASAAAAQAVDLRRRLRQQMEADLVRLAIAVARRIIRRELSVDPDALLGIVKSAVERIAAREVLSIKVCPRDEPCVQARLADLHLPDRVQIIADSSLSWGSVVIETTRGQHDASVETQIEEIDRGLADLVGRPS